jgi:carbon monoxide dehydrogenase subunit G
VRLENSFQVPGTPEQAWALLLDVPRVIPCMPGAELKEVVADDAWKANMHVKLGPISLTFATDVKREEVDEAARRVKLSTKARELKGRGAAQATIESSLSSEGGATTATIVTDLTMSGAVAQYGRGIVQDVASQMVKRFAECLAAELASAGPAEAAAAATETPAVVSEAGSSEPARVSRAAEPQPSSAEAAVPEAAGVPPPSSDGATRPSAAATPSPTAPPAPAPLRQAHPVKPVGGLGLAAGALWRELLRKLRIRRG